MTQVLDPGGAGDVRAAPLAVLADWILIGEEPHARDIAGGLLILVGVAIGTRRAPQ